MRIERKDYWIEDDQPWSQAEGCIGLEIGDVQDSEATSIPIHLTCSVRQFWVPVPDTPYEISVECSGFDIQISMNGVKLVHGTQVGTTTNPHTREVLFEETVNDMNTREGSGSASASVDLSARKIGIRAALKGSIGRINRKNTNVSTKKKYKRFQTTVSYIPSNSWHVRSNYENENGSYFSGTVFSDIICRVEGLGDQAEISCKLHFPPEFIECSTIREIKTGKNLAVDTVKNPDAKIGDPNYFIDNKKLAVINSLIKSLASSYEGPGLILATHNIKMGAKDEG